MQFHHLYLELHSVRKNKTSAPRGPSNCKGGGEVIFNFPGRLETGERDRYL